MNILRTTSLKHLDSIDSFLQEIFIVYDIIRVSIHVIIDIIMFKFIEYYMSVLNDNRDVINFIDFQIFEISRDFVSSVLQFDHFIDEIKDSFMIQTFDVSHDVCVRQRFVFVISNMWMTNDENAMNLINQLFVEEREECLIEEFFSNSNVISSSILNLILSIEFWSNFLLYQFFRVEKIMLISNSTCY
jgi:hypothetical protein